MIILNYNNSKNILILIFFKLYLNMHSSYYFKLKNHIKNILIKHNNILINKLNFILSLILLNYKF